MSHDSFEHNLNDHEDPIAGPTWTVGIAGTVLLAVTFLGVTGLYYDLRDNEADEKVAGQPRVERTLLDLEQASRLDGPYRIELRPENPDREQSIVIPIDEAIGLIVAEARGGGD